MDYSVYIDVLFFVNLMINTVILTASATLMKLKYSPLRVFSGAFAGAVYACIIFFPELHILYTLIFKIIMAMLISFISFAPKSFKQLAVQTAVFFGTTAVFGILSLALLYFTDIGIKLGGVISNGIFYFNIPIVYLAASCAISYIAIVAVQRFLKKNSLRNYTHITVVNHGKSVDLKALVDTGNMLKDPFSGKTVMIAEASVMAPLFEFDIKKIIGENADLSNLPPGFRLIPFSSIGNQSGILIAFVPEKIIINNCEQENIVAALYNSTLSKSREYNALLNPEALC